MKIAIVGSGIAGNVVAFHLSQAHEITVFEANAHIGGHAHTHTIERNGKHFAIDTGFIVFNHKTYPHFTELLKTLGVSSQASEMSFSVKCEKTGLEYNGTSLNGLFAQRRNLLKPRFYRMLRDILQFNQQARAFLKQQDASLTLAEYLKEHRYSRAFREHYLIPMGAAIWSMDSDKLYEFPASQFLHFFENHGLLRVNNRPQWHVIQGGSKRYVEKLVAPFVDQIRLNTPVKAIRRFAHHVEIDTEGQAPARFDRVFLACHSDQALHLLAEPTLAEKEILGAIPYQTNEAILHTDHSILPARPLAWAAWNYHILNQTQQNLAVTYNMNILQRLQTPVQFCVTLNHTEKIEPHKILKRIQYQHPIYTLAGISAQKRHHEINGPQHTYFCGAYWRYGFHEDGVVSALEALKHFKEHESDAQLHLRRAG